MDEMIIRISTTKRLYFRQVLNLLKGFEPLNKCQPRELDVLAELYYWNYYYKDIPEESRGKLIFDYDTKRAIADYLNIDNAVLDNSLSALRKKNIIVGRKVPKTFNIEFNKSIIFQFVENE